jgi:L-glyceraldehyde 3-phosphate reductase
MGVRPLIHQPSYSIFDRWVEGDRLLDALERDGLGCIVFSPLAQGLLTSRYLNGIPPGSRASRGWSLSADVLTPAVIGHLHALADIAKGRDQTLAQMALSWVLRDQRVTAALVGASSVAQLEENLRAVTGPAFTAIELAAIDEHSAHAGIAFD